MDYNHLNNKYNCIKIAVLSASNGEPSKIEKKICMYRKMRHISIDVTRNIIEKLKWNNCYFFYLSQIGIRWKKNLGLETNEDAKNMVTISAINIGFLDNSMQLL